MDDKEDEMSLYLIRGLPGSGKTTEANRLLSSGKVVSCSVSIVTARVRPYVEPEPDEVEGEVGDV